MASWHHSDTMKLYNYIDDTILISDSVPDLEKASPLQVHHLQEQEWAVNTNKL